MIEKIVNDETSVFFSENNILHNFQSGFGPNYSTNLCLAHLTDKILKGFDEGLLIWMIHTDLQNAFDTIYHKVLLQKLKATRFSHSHKKWEGSLDAGHIVDIFAWTWNVWGGYTRNTSRNI